MERQHDPTFLWKEPDDERAYWDSRGVSLAQARRAVWAPPPGPPGWQDGIDICLEQILPQLELVVGGRWNRLLDLGCGPGRMTEPVADRLGCAVVGVDVSPAAIGWAEKQRSSDRVLYAVTNGRDLPNSLGRFDGAWSMFLFQHIPTWATEHYIGEVSRLLRPSGRFCLQFCTSPGDSPQSHGLTENQMVGWCRNVGLGISEINRGRIHPDWTWMTVTAPSILEGNA